MSKTVASDEATVAETPMDAEGGKKATKGKKSPAGKTPAGKTLAGAGKKPATSGGKGVSVSTKSAGKGIGKGGKGIRSGAKRHRLLLRDNIQGKRRVRPTLPLAAHRIRVRARP